MNNIIICSECGTENELQYEYCKNCGANLKSEPKNSEPNNYGSSNNQVPYGFDTYNQDFLLETIDGVPSEDVITFVGKKSHAIIPKFNKMEICASKTSWCWPAAILGFMFGPLGAAIWFFYRKMHKIALVFAAIGIILSVTTTLLSGPVVDYDLLESTGESFYSGNIQGFYDALDQFLTDQDTVYNYIANAINSIADVVTMVVAGIFGFYWYKCHCVNSINRYKNMPVDPRYYKIGLASIGGTSSGMLVLGIAIMILSEDLVSSISLLM